MKIIEKDYGGITVRKAVLNARIVNGLNENAEPHYLDNENMTPYHWVDAELLGQDGVAVQQGAIIVWDKRLKENPERYLKGKVIPIEITLTGIGAGVAQEHLSNGRFDLEALGISSEMLQMQTTDREKVF